MQYYCTCPYTSVSKQSKTCIAMGPLIAPHLGVMKPPIAHAPVTYLLTYKCDI